MEWCKYGASRLRVRDEGLGGCALTVLGSLGDPGQSPASPERRLKKRPNTIYRFVSARNRGSSTSRRASPTRLTATTVVMMATPGPAEIHQPRRR
jgi:hypothetical protein